MKAFYLSLRYKLFTGRYVVFRIKESNKNTTTINLIYKHVKVYNLRVFDVSVPIGRCPKVEPISSNIETSELKSG